MGGRTIHVFNITISRSDVFHQRPRPRHLQAHTSYHLLSNSQYIPIILRRTNNLHSINFNIIMNINIMLPMLVLVAGAPWTFHRLVTIPTSTHLNHIYFKTFCRRRRLQLGLMNSRACIQCTALQIQTLGRCIKVFILLHNRHLRQLLIWILLIWHYRLETLG
jgi:hypothetical protein